MNKKTISYILKQKGNKKVTMLTCYDYSMAKIVSDTDLDMVLIGDSLGNVIAGHETTIPVTVDDMIYHTRAVKRAISNSLIVTDMPFMSYQVSLEQGLSNAGRIMKEGLSDALKLEGGEEIAELVYKLTSAGIPVCGHIGLQPQSVHGLGGFRVVGKTEKEVEKLVKGAKALQEAGAFAVVLELVPSETAEKLSEILDIVTIGIGSGPKCDGQVLVMQDMLGVNPENFKHSKKYLNLYDDCKSAFNQYIEEVEKGSFPAKENTFFGNDKTKDILSKLY